MLRHITNPDGFFKPFHFYQVQVGIEFNDTIDLFHNTLARLAHPAKGFTDENPHRRKESIQNPFKQSTPFLAVVHCEEAAKIQPDIL